MTRGVFSRLRTADVDIGWGRGRGDDHIHINCLRSRVDQHTSNPAVMQSSILCQPQACRAHPARRGASRPCRRVAVVKASSETEAYVPPSYRTAATELSALQRFSEVVPDVLLSQTLQKVEAPRAATASRSVLGGIIGNPSAPARYKVRASGGPGKQCTDCQILRVRPSLLPSGVT